MRAITLLSALVLSVVLLPGSPVGERSAGSGWSRLAAAPRSFDALAWTGRYVVAWGGAYSVGGPRADGALYDVASDQWRRIAAGPLAAREFPATAWTGSRVLFWGGEAARRRFADGAALDPDSRTWTSLPRAPLSPRAPAAWAWTGAEFIVWGDAGRAGHSRDGAAYDPVRRSWRRLPRAPLALNAVSSVWFDGNLVIYGAWLDHNNHANAAYARGIAYTPATNRWRVLRAFQLSPQASSVAAADGSVLAWDYVLQAGLYAPRTNRWTHLPPLPLHSGECSPSSATMGRVVVAGYCGQAAVFDVASRDWKPVRFPRGFTGGRLVAAGSRVLVLGRSDRGGPAQLWAYTP